jgi:hypothetical protein
MIIEIGDEQPVADPAGGERWPGPPYASATPKDLRQGPALCFHDLASTTSN